LSDAHRRYSGKRRLLAGTCHEGCVRRPFPDISLDIVTERESAAPNGEKTLLSIDEPEPKKIVRADRPPTEGSGRKLKAAYPMLQIEIYDADKRIRTLLSGPT